MTICIVALSQVTKAIVCVADKALSYRDTETQYDTDTTKIVHFGLEKKLVALISGGPHSTQVLANLQAIPDLGDNVLATIQAAETAYHDAYQLAQEKAVLIPRGLNRQLYEKILTKPRVNSVIENTVVDMKKFNMDCDIILAGFDTRNLPFILALEAPGQAFDVTRDGVFAIGAGFDKAIARVRSEDYQRGQDIRHVVYSLFDAKADTEDTFGIGFNWDGCVIRQNGNPNPLPTETKLLIEQVWSKYTRSPFKERDPIFDYQDPPDDWKDRLKELIPNVEDDA